MSLLIAWRIFQKPKGHFTVWQRLAKSVRQRVHAQLSIVQKHTRRASTNSKDICATTHTNLACALGQFHFRSHPFLYIHLSIHILLYECVHLICIRHTSPSNVVCWRTCRGFKVNTSQVKNIINRKHQNTWIHCAKIWWLTLHSIFLSAQTGGFEVDISHQLWDGWHDPEKHMVAFPRLVCIDLTIPPKGSVLFQRRVGGRNKVLCYLCYHSTFPTHPPHSRCKT